ncbi:hypothetical protein ACWDQZ_14695 [Streptomyces tendae]
MSEWIEATLCPQDVVPVNGRAQSYSSATTAFAYVIMGRLIEYDLWREGEESNSVPDLLSDDPMPHKEWELVRSAHRLLSDDFREFGTLELSKMAADREMHADLRVIACVLASIGYAELERYDQAVAICEDLLSQELDFSQPGEAMLQLHASMRNAEIKNYTPALRWAEAAKIALIRESTVSAIGQKTSDALLFSAEENINALSEVLSNEFFPPPTKRPSTPDAWLDLESTVGSAALEYMTESYKDRIVDRGWKTTTRIVGKEDYISRNLYAYLIRAQVAGHWKKYLQASRQLGMSIILRPSGEAQDVAKQISQGLSFLRTGWATKAYKDALSLVREEGPLAALDSELQKALTRLQRDITDLEMQVLRAGAPLLRAEEAQSVCRALLEAELPRRAPRAGGWYLTHVPLWEAVTALAREISDGDYLAQRMRSYVGDEDTTQAFHIERAASVLDWRRVSVAEQENWIQAYADSALEDGDDWKVLLDGILYKICRTGNRRALDLLNQVVGSSMTLAQAARIVDLPDEVGSQLMQSHSEAIIDLCVTSMAETQESAARNAWSFGGHNAALIAAVFSVKRSREEGLWDAIGDFLRDTAVAADHKDPVLDYLASCVRSVPSGFLQRVTRDPARLTSRHSSLFLDSDRPSGARLRFLCATGSLDESEAYDIFTLLASDDEPSSRAEAAKSIPFISRAFGNSIPAGYLLSMTMDRSVFVRARAAEALGSLLGSVGDGETVLSRRLIEMLGSDGVAVPFGALRGLRIAKENRVRFEQSVIVDSLQSISREHAMVRVRQAAKSLLS